MCKGARHRFLRASQVGSERGTLCRVAPGADRMRAGDGGATPRCTLRPDAWGGRPGSMPGLDHWWTVDRASGQWFRTGPGHDRPNGPDGPVIPPADGPRCAGAVPVPRPQRSALGCSGDGCGGWTDQSVGRGCLVRVTPGLEEGGGVAAADGRWRVWAAGQGTEWVTATVGNRTRPGLQGSGPHITNPYP